MMAPASNVTADTDDVHYPNTVRACQLVEQSWRNTATLYGYEEYDIDTESKLQNRRRYDIVAGAFSVSAYPSAAYLLRYEHAGCESPRADVEAIAIAKRGLDAMGIKRSAYNLRINDSEMLDLLLSEYLDLDAVQTSLMARLLAQKRTLAPDKFRDRAIDIVGLSHSSEVLQKLSKLLTARSAEDLPEVIRHSECYVNLVALYERLERLGIDNVILTLAALFSISPKLMLHIVPYSIRADATSITTCKVRSAANQICRILSSCWRAIPVCATSRALLRLIL